jgi:hypothetical protein
MPGMLSSTWNGPTIAATIVGSLGFLVAAVSLGWQILRARRERRTVIRVQMWRLIVMPLGGTRGIVLVIQALNESAHAVRVSKVGLDTRMRVGGIQIGFTAWLPPAGATLPGVIQPHDSGVTTYQLTVGEMEFAPTQADEIRAYVYTAAGQRFETAWAKPTEIPTTEQFGEIPVPADYLKPPPEGMVASEPTVE